MALKTVTPREEFVKGDQFPCSTNVDKPLVVRLVQFKAGIKTRYTAMATKPRIDGDGKMVRDAAGKVLREPDLYVQEHGDTGVIVDVVDLTERRPWARRNVLWMTGAVRDQLKRWADAGEIEPGDSIVVKLSNSAGYVQIVPGNEDDVAAYTEFQAKHGDLIDAEDEASPVAKKGPIPGQSKPPAVEMDPDEDDVLALLDE